ncbi:hypothetical protein [uncultured Desulfosarcina sp.]|uniref:hypothetical protein n=1 Tax=uncultured Desulfosarcina sp. TaxID=218289 RepID=UPI0029C93E00|nr:hypothetical protein [uncultured Desulfosarcina sp.]
MDHFHGNHLSHPDGVNGDQITDLPLISPGVVIKPDTLTVIWACDRHGGIVNAATYAIGLSNGKHPTVNRFDKSGEKKKQCNHYENNSFHISPPIQDILACRILKMRFGIFKNL